jgi:hypothetical protein
MEEAIGGDDPRPEPFFLQFPFSALLPWRKQAERY